MKNQQAQKEIIKLIRWNKPEVRVLTINQDTSLVNSNANPILVDQE